MTTHIRSEDFSNLTTRWATHEDERPAIETALRNAGLIVEVKFQALLGPDCQYLDITIPDNICIDEQEMEADE